MLATAPAELGTAPALGPILQMRAIEKRFPGVHALADVSMEVLPGEVHALVGENGAGKSTLMKILAGVYMPDGGEIIYKGRPYAPRTPRQAINAGIVTIYQELNLVPELTITENMFLGTELHRGPLLEWRAMHGRARELLARLHLEINPRTVISRLGVGQQQMVEVAKALLHEADLIIMDEPTAALSLREIDDLFQIVRELKEHGVSTIFISHHLDEAFALSDRITVLRDGQHVATRATRELTRTELIGLMVGRELAEHAPKKPVPPGAEILRVEGLTRRGVFEDVSFTARAGEVVGLAGLVGAGRTEVVRAIFGADPIDAGTIHIDGQPVNIRNPRDAIDHGIALLTEDRKGQGLILIFDVRENISLAVLDRLTRGQFTSRSRETRPGVGVHRPPGHQGLEPAAAGPEPLRRHPAEGRAQQVAGSQGQGHHLRRADAWHRRGRQGRDLRHHERAGGPGRHHPHGQLRAAGDPGHERPGPGDAGWPHPRRAVTGRGHPGAHHGPGHGVRSGRPRRPRRRP